MPSGSSPQPSRRGRKVNVNFAVSPDLVARFRKANEGYVGRLSGCFSAALAMWLAADPQTQGRWLKRVTAAEIDDEVDELLGQLQLEQQLSARSPRVREGPSAGEKTSRS